MADFKYVPVLDVQLDNIGEMEPVMRKAIKQASFIGLDLELSGLGNRKMINASQMEDRYKAISEAATTRSVISVGLSCFTLVSTVPRAAQTSGDDRDYVSAGCRLANTKYLVQNFNITVLCQQSYVVEPAALRFLLEHGFDFNIQYSQGVPYYRGKDSELHLDNKVGTATKPHKTCTVMRDLFSYLVLQGSPVVLHNGLVDLIYMYANFYAPLPSDIQSLIADLSEMFPGGVYDTKYICEYKSRYAASYLEYLFRKSQRDNGLAATVHRSSFVSVTFPPYPDELLYLNKLPCALPSLQQQEEEEEDEDIAVCDNYANYGWCAAGRQCKNSHNVDHVLNLEEKKRQKRREKDRKRKYPGQNGNDVDSSAKAVNKVSNEDITGETTSNAEKILAKPRSKGHRAGYDAFMTGFCFACNVLKFARISQQCDVGQINFNSLDMATEFSNKIYLSGKDFPLQLVKSIFSKTSKEHRMKLERLRGLNT